jgi:tol-pal system protein YbgF
MMHEAFARRIVAAGALLALVGLSPWFAAPAPVLAQDAASIAARQEVRIQQLETQLRALTGQIEDLTYRNRQVMERLDKLVADIDFRLRQIEQGGPVAMVPGEGGEQTAGTAGGPAAATATVGLATATPTQPPASQAAPVGGTQVLGTLTQSEFESQQSGFGRATAAPEESGTSAQAGMPQVSALPAGTPDEQYQHAFGLLRQLRYAEAEQALRRFIELNPDHPLAGNASYWLGETFYVRSDYNNAAIAFAEGYRSYPKSGKAPDSLLKLGMTLAALGESADACTAFAELEARYPAASDTIRDRLYQERARIGC